MADKIYVVVSGGRPITVVVSGAVPPPKVVAVGRQGPPGAPAFTTTTADFTQPEANDNVTISVVDTTWMPVGIPLYIAGGGTYAVAAVPDKIHVTITNLGANGNAATGTVIIGGAKVAPGGGAFVGVDQDEVIALIEALA